MSLHLFRRPGAVVFLDDDPDYLETLAMVLPRHWHVRLFLRPAHCIHQLQREPPLWEIDAWNQQLIVDQWRQGKPLIPQILGYWARSSDRFSMTRVCVVDYSMPGMDGLEVLAELHEWQGAKVLLTGVADEQVAVRAFNRRLIDQFIPKQTPDISKRLVESVEHMLAATHERHDQIWRATLRPEQHALLRLQGVHGALEQFISTHWVEHVVIGEPFGILGMSATGKVSWLQLETSDGLEAMAELAEIEGIAGPQLDDIRSGRRLSGIELRQALGLTGPGELMTAFAPGDGALLAALFEVPATSLPAPMATYGEWQARQEQRHVED
ncbi:MAG TPA: response regulator [Ramlibacter sp.]|nr:response regulator [Ramlibacter sp.]